jgi:hypothetical protein
VVTLQSNNAAARVPTSVTVAAGQTSATFTISTTAVTAAQSVTIAATYGGASKTAALTVNPSVQNPFFGKYITIEGSFGYGNINYAAKIQLEPSYSGTHLARVSAWPSTSVGPNTFTVTIEFMDVATFSGNTITFDGALGYILFAAGGGEVIVSGQMTLTAASAAVGASVSGSLKFSTTMRTVEGQISGAIAAIQ